jgi:hypothetical protein
MKQVAGWLVVGTALMLGMTACESRHFPTAIVYESPSSFVRLELDPRAAKDGGYTHPVEIDATRMAAVLSGLVIVQPPKWRYWFRDSEKPSRHRAFTQAEIEFFAPLIAQALQQATEEEVVTFYQSRRETAIVRKVTSGQIFVRGERMHVVLANYRSPTHYASDPGVADTQDDRLTPSKPIAPQVERVEFDPPTVSVEEPRGVLSRLFVTTPRQVVVLYRQMPIGAPATTIPGD